MQIILTGKPCRFVQGSRDTTTFRAQIGPKCSGAPSGGGSVPPCGCQEHYHTLEWQVERKRGPLVFFCRSLQANFATVSFNNGSGNVEAKARTLLPAGVSQTAISAEELIQDGLGRACSLVVHADMRFAWSLIGSYKYNGIFVGKFYGIVPPGTPGLTETTVVPISNDGGIRHLSDKSMIGSDRP